jgi:lipid-A-disaccharide synthase
LTKSIYLVTTESSGDLLGSRLVKALRKEVQTLDLYGVGGDQLLEMGQKQSHHVRDFNLMGLFEVLRELKRLKRIMKEMVAEIEQLKPDLVVLIDAPDWNLRLAKALQGKGIPVVYYVSPQIWAWRKGRAKKVAQIVDHMLVLFSFEEDLYRPYGLPTTWVGHPLVDELVDLGDRDDWLETHGFASNKPLIALAPGSRASLVKRMLPVMREVVAQRRDQYQFALPMAPVLDEAPIREMMDDLPVKLLSGQLRPLMKHADAALVASGTTTLETGLLRTPMVVGYRMKTLSYWMARLLVQVPHIALVNLVLDKRVVPELIQKEFAADKIVPLLDEMVIDGPRRRQILKDFDRLEDILGGGGASEKAAAVVKDFLDR